MVEVEALAAPPPQHLVVAAQVHSVVWVQVWELVLEAALQQLLLVDLVPWAVAVRLVPLLVKLHLLHLVGSVLHPLQVQVGLEPLQAVHLVVLCPLALRPILV